MQIHWLIPSVMALVIAAGLTLDILYHNVKEPISLAKASGWSLFWIAISLGFAGWLYAAYGSDTAGLFLSGWIMEKALSVDNLMVFTAIFAYFSIPDQYQHKILHYGIIGAIVSRLVFTVIGTGSLILFGPYVAAIFGLIVLWSAVQMTLGVVRGEGEEDEEDYNKKWYARVLGRYFPITYRSDSASFFVKLGTKTFITPLFVCLVTIEISDIMFSFDSVPAVIAIVQEPTLVYAAMLFAIMGLRSLYFVLSALMRYLAYLPAAVCGILYFIAIKMLVQAANGIFKLGWPELSPVFSVSCVLGVLVLGVLASLIVHPHAEQAP
jgi:tellurite resistance protein TerC